MDLEILFQVSRCLFTDTNQCQIGKVKEALDVHGGRSCLKMVNVFCIMICIIFQETFPVGQIPKSKRKVKLNDRRRYLSTLMTLIHILFSGNFATPRVCFTLTPIHKRIHQFGATAFKIKNKTGLSFLKVITCAKWHFRELRITKNQHAERIVIVGIMSSETFWHETTPRPTGYEFMRRSTFN